MIRPGESPARGRGGAGRRGLVGASHVLVAVLLGLVVGFGLHGQPRVAHWVDALVWHSRSDALALTPQDLASVLDDPNGTPRRVVVIVPHMDDETFFCGETLAAFDERGIDVTVVFTTTSQGGRAMVPSFEADRHATYARVARILGIDRTFISPIPDGARLGGLAAKTRLTEDFVRSTGAIGAGCVLFTIGGGGHYDHRVAERVGRDLARAYGVPLFVYWGYAQKSKWRTASDKDWGPDMIPIEFGARLSSSCIRRKDEAILAYRRMYLARGWVRYWPSVWRYEFGRRDQIGFVPRP